MVKLLTNWHHPSDLQTPITSLWDKLADVLMKDQVPSSPLQYTPSRHFDNFPGAVGALDASLIMISKPSNRDENRLYFSGKHYKHGVKFQALVAPDGILIHYGGTIPGSRHDMKLYEESGLDRAMLRGRVQDERGVVSTRPQILADGGYKGIHLTYPEAILPNRKPRGNQLTPQQIEFNRRVGHDRSVVERYFGRMKCYWSILQRPYRCDKCSMEVLIKICIGLTNLKIKTSPMFLEGALYVEQEEEDVEEEEEASSLVSQCGQLERPQDPSSEKQLKRRRKKK